MYEAIRRKHVRGCRRVNLPQTCRHGTQWCRRRCTPSARNSLTCNLNHRSTASSTFHLTWGFSWATQTFEDRMVTSRGCVQNVCVPPISSWRSVGPQLGAIWERALYSRMMLSVSVPEFILWSLYSHLKRFYRSLWICFAVTWFEVSISFWSYSNRFTTLHAIFKLCSSVVRNLRSCSQMPCLSAWKSVYQV